MNWSWLYGVPVGALLGIFLAAYWPFGKGPEGPPYVSFDEKLDAYLSDRESFRNSPYVAIDPGEKVTGAAFLVYGTPGHGRTFGPNADIPENIGEGLHPGRPCGPACWRKPDGHRWGE